MRKAFITSLALTGAGLLTVSAEAAASASSSPSELQATAERALQRAEAETISGSKSEYLTSGRYQQDVTKSAAPATAWIQERSTQIDAIKAACQQAGHPVATLRAATDSTKPPKSTSKSSKKKKSKKRKRKKPSTLPSAATCAAAPKPAVVFDIDETLMSNYFANPTFLVEMGSAGIAPGSVFGTGVPLEGVKQSYEEAVKRGIAIFMITGRPEWLRTVTEDNLKRVGYSTWNKIVLETSSSSGSKVAYKSGARKEIEDQGYTIIANVGDQYSDLEGGYSERTFKITNPFYFTP